MILAMSDPDNDGQGLQDTVATISFKLTNTGDQDGSDIPQLYIGYPDGAGEPPKVLRGFEEVVLAKNENEIVSFPLQERDLRFVVATNIDIYIYIYIRKTKSLTESIHLFMQNLGHTFTGVGSPGWVACGLYWSFK